MRRDESDAMGRREGRKRVQSERGGEREGEMGRGEGLRRGMEKEEK